MDAGIQSLSYLETGAGRRDWGMGPPWKTVEVCGLTLIHDEAVDEWGTKVCGGL